MLAQGLCKPLIPKGNSLSLFENDNVVTHLVVLENLIKRELLKNTKNYIYSAHTQAI